MLYPRTEKQEKLIALAQELAAKFDARAAEHDRNGTFPLENYVDAKAAGLPSLIIPAEYGGWEANLLDTVMTVEQLAVGDGSTALCLTMHFQTLGATVENRSWPPELFERICREAVEQSVLVNSVATEPKLGSPSRGGLPQTTAKPLYEDNGAGGTPTAWRINGHKSWATMFPALDYMIIPATLQDGTDEVARFLVPTALPHGGRIEAMGTFDAMGMRSTASHDIILDDVKVPHANMVSRSDSAAPRKRGSVNPWFMLCLSAVYVGVALAAHRTAVQYAKERVPTALGKPIAEVEGIQRRLGHAELLLRQARVLTFQAAEMWDQFPEHRGDMTATIATAKYTATNNAIAAVDECMRVAGGASMMKSLPLERYYRDVRGGLNHPMNDDLALITLGKLAIERVEETEAVAA
jgi:alkylation response protein AidB-like acyl-CoA dehydrogenase